MSRSRTDAEDLHEHRDDEGEWGDTPEAIEVKGSSTEVVSFRLASDELDALVEAAAEVGESLSEYIRRSIGVRLHGDVAGATAEVTSTATRLTVTSGSSLGGSRDAPETRVQDVPPPTVAVL